MVPSVPVSSVRKLLSARLWAASSAASRCASWASNAAKAASSSVRPVRDSFTAWASFSSTVWRTASRLRLVAWVKPCSWFAMPSSAPSFLATSMRVA